MQTPPIIQLTWIENNDRSIDSDDEVDSYIVQSPIKRKKPCCNNSSTCYSRYLDSKCKLRHISEIYPMFINDMIEEYIKEISSFNDFDMIKKLIFNYELPPNLKMVLWNSVLINSIKHKDNDLFTKLILNDIIEIDKNISCFIFENGTSEMIELLLKDVKLLSLYHFYEKISFLPSYLNNEANINFKMLSKYFIHLYQKYGRFIKKWIRNGMSFNEIEVKIEKCLFGRSLNEDKDDKTCSITYKLLLNLTCNIDKFYNLFTYVDYDTFEQFMSNINLTLCEKYIFYLFTKFVLVLFQTEKDDFPFYISMDRIFYNDESVIDSIIYKYKDIVIKGCYNIDLVKYLLKTKDRVYITSYIQKMIHYSISILDKLNHIAFDFIQELELLEYEYIDFIVSLIFNDYLYFNYYIILLNDDANPKQFNCCLKYITPKNIKKYKSYNIEKILTHKIKNSEYEFLYQATKEGLDLNNLTHDMIRKWPIEKIDITEENITFFSNLKYNLPLIHNFVPLYINSPEVRKYIEKIQFAEIVSFFYHNQGCGFYFIPMIKLIIDKAIKDEKYIQLFGIIFDHLNNQVEHEVNEEQKKAIIDHLMKNEETKRLLDIIKNIDFLTIEHK